MKIFKEKKIFGKKFKTYEDALEASTTRDIEVKMDLEDFHQIRYEAEKKIEEEKERANNKIFKAEQKQNEITRVAEKIVADIIEQEKKGKEILLKTLRRVRKEKKLKPKEIEKEKLIKAEYLAKKKKYLEHWLMPVPPEPELVEVALKWVKSKEWQEYTEKIYFQPGTGWIAVIHVGEAFYKEVRDREKEQVQDREKEQVRIWEEEQVQIREVYQNTNTERGREEKLYSRDTH